MHAMRREGLRREVLERHERQLDPDSGLERIYEDYAIALTQAFVETRSTT